MLFPFHQSRESGTGAAGPGFRELHLYHGSRCNRACAFCTVSGEPAGWHAPFPGEVLDAALRWTAREGNLKIYGGEPTLDLPGLLRAVRYLRRGGFAGWITLFSNGVLARRVTALLRADARCEVVLNHSILHGQGAPPLPPGARRVLEAAAVEFPGRLFSSHPDLVPVGRGAAGPSLSGRGAFGQRCPRCSPVLTSRGRLHACPFAVEYARPHYDLGEAAGSGGEAVARHAAFLSWIEAAVEPAARAAGEHPCRVCTRWPERAERPSEAFPVLTAP